MIYKMLPKLMPDDQQVFARIDDDGLCRVTCVAANSEFQAHIAAGGSLLDADGNEMTSEQIQEFLATLP
jgi:hypothetical protein